MARECRRRGGGGFLNRSRDPAPVNIFSPLPSLVSSFLFFLFLYFFPFPFSFSFSFFLFFSFNRRGGERLSDSDSSAFNLRRYFGALAAAAFSGGAEKGGGGEKK